MPCRPAKLVEDSLAYLRTQHAESGVPSGVQRDLLEEACSPSELQATANLNGSKLAATEVDGVLLVAHPSGQIRELLCLSVLGRTSEDQLQVVIRSQPILASHVFCKLTCCLLLSNTVWSNDQLCHYLPWQPLHHRAFPLRFYVTADWSLHSVQGILLQTFQQSGCYCRARRRATHRPQVCQSCSCHGTAPCAAKTGFCLPAGHPTGSACTRRLPWEQRRIHAHPQVLPLACITPFDG